MDQVLIPIFVPLIFYAFMAVVILVPVTLHYRNKAAYQRVISDALAKGQPLDPELIERLIPPAKGPNPRGIAFWFAAPGVLLAAMGIGLACAGIYFPEDQIDMADKLTGAIVMGTMGGAFILIAVLALVLFKPR